MTVPNHYSQKKGADALNCNDEVFHTLCSIKAILGQVIFFQLPVYFLFLQATLINFLASWVLTIMYDV